MVHVSVKFWFLDLQSGICFVSYPLSPTFTPNPTRNVKKKKKWKKEKKEGKKEFKEV
jgi:hypothetical protein